MAEPKAKLREGFTTGTAAAAAAKAATLLLATGWRGDRVDVPLPIPGRLSIPVADVRLEGDGARAVVVKDGGDDPDATHGARIECFVRLVREGAVRNSEDAERTSGSSRTRRVAVEGGRGVGRATLPGLPVEPGQAAINPAPRLQIQAAVAEALAGLDADASVLVEVPDGEAMAKRTLNPRLGILGGISILGTSGVVKPYSHAAWEATIREGLDVAKAVGFSEVFLTTGRRSERFLLALRPEVSETAMVQAADHFGLATAEAAERGFASVAWCLFFGKLAKQAQGLANTHAKEAAIDFAALAELVRSAGLETDLASDVTRAHTALQAQGIVRKSAAWDAALRAVARAGLAHMRRRAGPGPVLSYYLFDFDGELLLHEQDAPR